MKTMSASLFHSTQLLSAVAVAIMLLNSPPPVAAHGLGDLNVRRLDPSRPAPVVDGVCDEAEYLGASTYQILYRPRTDADPATIRAVATDSDLFICISGLGYRPQPQPSTVSVLFDRDHDGCKG